jgi:hypothetical protein
MAISGWKAPLATTWLISFEQIRSRDTLAADFLSFMACLDRRDIPLSLLPTNPSGQKERYAIETLAAYSMIVRRPAGSALDIHQLVHLITQNWLRTQGSLGQWSETAITSLLDIFPDENHWNRSKWKRLLPHVKHVLKIWSYR